MRHGRPCVPVNPASMKLPFSTPLSFETKIAGRIKNLIRKILCPKKKPSDAAVYCLRHCGDADALEDSGLVIDSRNAKSRRDTGCGLAVFPGLKTSVFSSMKEGRKRSVRSLFPDDRQYGSGMISNPVRRQGPISPLPRLVRPERMRWRRLSVIKRGQAEAMIAGGWNLS